MSEFNGRKFYGFSHHNDPRMSTTARNFEFRYTRPELLERAIQKVKQADAMRARNASVSKCCKVKVKTSEMSDVMPRYQPRDMDVETHISRKSSQRSSVRTLSECEVNRLIMWARSSVNPDPNTLKEMSDQKTSEAITYVASARGDCDGKADVDDRLDYDQIGDHETFVPNINKKQQNTISTAKDVLETDTLQCTALSQQWAALNPIAPQPKRTKILMEEYRAPQPQWVEIHEKPQNCKELAAEIMEPMGRSHSSIVDEMMNQVRERALTSSMPNITIESIETNDAAYDVVDSDLEYEMLEREGYTKLCEPRPLLEELPNASNDSGGIPQFIEMEPDLPCMNLSFLRNTSPMRYSEPTDEKSDDKPKAMKVVIKSKQNTPENHAEESLTTAKPTATKELKKKKIRKPKKNVEKEITPSNAEKPIESPKSTKSSPRSQSNRQKHSAPTTPSSQSTRNSPRLAAQGDMSDRYHKNLVLSKSFEELKQEKTSIFNKMNSTQERLIELMDQLRISLMEKHAPTSNYEKHKKQKNALEFSVRFSRNFLYPLKGMIDDLRIMSNDQLHSATSNEASQRVLSIFSLLCQSLQVYQKQLRYFLLDQVPQKLGLLMDMICDAITICLEKQVFDRNDITVECLHDRCYKFINFLNDLQEDSTACPQNNFKAGVTNNYNLKMFMNDLNMYEPKLVPKNLSIGRRRPNTRKLKCKTNQLDHSPHVSDIALTKCNSQTVETQIEGMQAIGSSDAVTGTSCFATPNTNRHSSSLSVLQTDMDTDALNKALVEALQTVTKEQVRQVLEPIMKTLGVTLGQKINGVNCTGVRIRLGIRHQGRLLYFDVIIK